MRIEYGKELVVEMCAVRYSDGMQGSKEGSAKIVAFTLDYAKAWRDAGRPSPEEIAELLVHVVEKTAPKNPQRQPLLDFMNAVYDEGLIPLNYFNSAIGTIKNPSLDESRLVQQARETARKVLEGKNKK